jgi:hypothetical protein
VDSILRGIVPRAIRLAAARGALPIPRADLARVLITLEGDPDQEIRQEATTYLDSWSEEELRSFASDAGTDPIVLSFLLNRTESRGSLLPTVLSNPSTPLDSLLHAARTFAPENLDILLLNQTLLIAHPDLLDEVEANPAATPLHRARVEELRRHFLQPSVAAPPNVAPDISMNSTVSAAGSEPGTPAWHEDPGQAPGMFPLGQTSPSPQFPRIGESSIPTDPTPPADEAGVAPQHEGVMQRIYKMNVGEKIQLAQKGTREERTLLIRDSNRSVQDAVLNSPKLTENEIDCIARMRNVNEDILRQIAGHRDWVKTYSVAQALATNPKTPVGIAMNLLSRLTTHDLKVIQTDKNVSEAIRRMARKQVEVRANKAGSSRGSGH